MRFEVGATYCVPEVGFRLCTAVNRETKRITFRKGPQGMRSIWKLSEGSDGSEWVTVRLYGSRHTVRIEPKKYENQE